MSARRPISHERRIDVERSRDTTPYVAFCAFDWCLSGTFRETLEGETAGCRHSVPIEEDGLALLAALAVYAWQIQVPEVNEGFASPFSLFLS